MLILFYKLIYLIWKYGMLYIVHTAYRAKYKDNKIYWINIKIELSQQKLNIIFIWIQFFLFGMQKIKYLY